MRATSLSAGAANEALNVTSQTGYAARRTAAPAMKKGFETPRSTNPLEYDMTVRGSGFLLRINNTSPTLRDHVLPARPKELPTFVAA